MSGNGTEQHEAAQQRHVAIRQEQPTALGLMPQNMREAIELAKMMAGAKTGMPKHLQGDPGTCLMIVEQAMRWNMSPFAVAQCTSSIGGKLMFEGKLVAAAVESSGAIEGHFDYTFSGEGDDRTVTVTATRRGERTPRSIEIRLGDVKTTNEWWRKQPEQQLVYSGTRNWARRWTPAAMLGVYTPEEFGRNVDAVVDNYGGPTIEGAAEQQTDDAELAEAAAKTPPPQPPQPPPQDARLDGIPDRWRSYMASFLAKLDAAEDYEGITALSMQSGVSKVLASEQTEPEVKEAIQGFLNAAWDQFREAPQWEENEPLLPPEMQAKPEPEPPAE